MKTKICTKCSENYPATKEYFPKAKQKRDKLSSWCRECSRKSVKRYQQSEQGKLTVRKRFYQQKFGITIEDYNKVFQKQNGCCAMCNRHQSEFKQWLSIDHNHKTKKIRGLLCVRCNNYIGYIENKAVYKLAMKYLKKEVH